MSEEAEEPNENQRTDELANALAKEKQTSEQYLTQLKYVQADLENLKKRKEREIEEAREYCNERIIIELLDIVDELELAIKCGRSSNSKEAIVQGVEMTLKKLKKILEKEGVHPIECLSKPFDPLRHNAVSKVERDDIDECMVIEEIRKGYIMKEKVIRPSIVKVAIKRSFKPKDVEVKENE